MVDPVTIVLLGRPIPSAQGRVSKQGFRFVPKKQTEAVSFIRAVASQEMLGREMLTGPLKIFFYAEVPIPTTWSKKNKMAALLKEIWPTKKPDLKNLAALAEDALKTVVYSDDSRVCEHHNVKRYGDQPKIVMTISQLPGREAP